MAKINYPDTPKTLSDVTLDYMKEYVTEKGNKEIKVWYYKLYQNNMKDFPNHLKGTRGHENAPDTIRRADVKPIRRAFCEKFFPGLLKKNKPTPKKRDPLGDLKDSFGLNDEDLV